MKDKKILFCFGTRPEWLKIKPILSLLNRDSYKLLFTGQHEDLLNNIQFDYKIKIGDVSPNRLNSIISECLSQFPTDDTFNSILVQGDTASAYACALAGFHNKLKIYYLEAGLRSHDLDNPYPEEAYRQMIARVSNINFCPTILSETNLKNEIVMGTTHITGNTSLDNLLSYKSECEYQNKVLVTLHRRENHDTIEEWFTELNQIAEKYKELDFILPIHPNPNVYRHKHLLTNVTVVSPMPHEELLKLLTKVKFIISDSGGIQEEASFFNKKVIVCRKTTERPEGLDTGHLILCESPKELSSMVDKLNFNYYINIPSPYGDGYASHKIVEILNENF